MPETCRHCGAILPGGQSCQDVFNLGQVKEFEDAAYGAVHQLSVPSYMMQHNAYSRAGWLGARELLEQFLNGLTPGEAMRQNREKLDSGKRGFSITQGTKLPGVELLKWSFTVSDVRLDRPEHYCADVRRWAESVLADSAGLVRGLQAEPVGSPAGERNHRRKDFVKKSGLR
jgi:hypothetical protein